MFQRGRRRARTNDGPLRTARRQPVQDAAGHDLRPDPLTAQTAAPLVTALARYRQWAGEPTYRSIAGSAHQKVSHSTIYQVLRGQRKELPALKVVLTIIEGCGGSDADVRAFATAWRRVRAGR